jgi:hypothetical protein
LVDKDNRYLGMVDMHKLFKDIALAKHKPVAEINY